MNANIAITEIEPQTVLFEDEWAYQETYEPDTDWEDYGIEITPLAKSLTGILTGENYEFIPQEETDFEEPDEDYGIEITPLAKSLTGILKIDNVAENYDWRAAFYEDVIKK